MTAREPVVTVTSDVELVVALAADMPRLRRMARVLVGEADAADDLVADAIARTLPQWRKGSIDEPGAYVRRAMVNLASRRWRRLALGRRKDHAAADWFRHTPETGEVLAERDRTLRAVMNLPVRRRAIVLLRFYEDLPLAEIASVLGVAEGTVKSQLSRSLEQLRGELGGQEE